MHDTTQPSKLILPTLAAANFIIGMGAFMIVGMLNTVAETFSMSPARSGWLMILYSLGYAFSSPLLVSLTGGIGRRRILTAGLGLFALSCLVAAVAPTEAILLGSRVLAAAGAGIVTPVAAAVASGLSPPHRQARALATVFLGLSLAQVLGVPFGGFVAYTFGWRTAFLMVALLSLPVLLLIWIRVPAGLSFRPVSLRDLGRCLVDFRLMLAISFTSFYLGSNYVVYTFIAPLLSETMEFGRNGITLLMLTAGGGAVVGNLLGGWVTDRIGPFRTLLFLASAQVVIMPFYSGLPVPVLLLIAVSFVWAGVGWAFMAAQQSRLLAIAPENASILMALNAAAIYIGAAIGSGAGAAVISRSGLGALGYTGASGALVALVILLISQRLNSGRTR